MRKARNRWLIEVQSGGDAHAVMLRREVIRVTSKLPIGYLDVTDQDHELVDELMSLLSLSTTTVGLR